MFRLIKQINCYNSRYVAKAALSEMTLQNLLSVVNFSSSVPIFLHTCHSLLIPHALIKVVVTN